jgi:hypothetical protein
MPTVEANSGLTTSSPTATPGNSHRPTPTRAAMVDSQPAVTAVDAISTRPSATIGRPVTSVPSASSHTFSGDVAVFAVRNSVSPQDPCKASVFAYDSVM